MNATSPAPSVPPAESRPKPPVSRLQRLLAYRNLLLIALTVFVLDQLTKLWIAEHLPFPTYGEPGAIRVIRGFFYLVHVGNTGAAWSMFSGQSMILALLAGATLIAIFLWRHSLGLRERLAQICFGLLCGGIAGNLVDRLMHGHVIDFIDLHFGSYVYPTFNVADAGICVGVIVYLWHSFREPRR
ncbi:MAG TPA: signal peptidase II [Opitutus sp.]|nr:signal peptidase II [Opitutus sp.]